jgi:hypothetical protein
MLVFLLIQSTYSSGASPGKQTTVIVSEKKEQLKAAHEAKNEPQALNIPVCTRTFHHFSSNNNVATQIWRVQFSR